MSTTYTPARFILKWDGSQYKVNFPAGDLEVECVRADVADALLAAAEAALPYLQDKAEKFPGGDAELLKDKLREAIRLAKGE